MAFPALLLLVSAWSGCSGVAADPDSDAPSSSTPDTEAPAVNTNDGEGTAASASATENGGAPSASAETGSPPTSSSTPSQTAGPTPSAEGTPEGTPSASPSETGAEQGPAFLPARVRRLTGAEYRASVEQLLGVPATALDGLVPDTRQSGFTRNAAQIVDPLFARQIQEAAQLLAAEFVATRMSAEVPCATTTPDASCARSFYEGFLPQAYRRPLGDGELDALMAVYEAGAIGDFNAGMELSLGAVLQSAAFIYATELGDAAAPQEPTSLTAYETASAMAYLLTGQPPDEALQSAAEAGTLNTAEGRTVETQRLLGTPVAELQIARMIEEWLGIDGVVDVGKDKERFPEYEQLRPFMLEETSDFITEVVFNDAGNLTTLLGADYTIIGPEMAAFYDLQSPGAASRVSLGATNRRGVLNHASFLARYATEVDSAPVHRGVAVARRVMCIDPGDPTGLNIDIVPPQPDPGLTTRERFTQHTIDPACAGCHSGIDGLGFTFEGFDAIGADRTMDNGKPVDTATDLPDGWAAELDQAEFADSAALATTLARSEGVKRCFARHLSRHAGAATDRASEDYFIAQWEQLEAEQRDSILEVLIAYVASDVFVSRSAQRDGGAR